MLRPETLNGMLKGLWLTALPRDDRGREPAPKGKTAVDEGAQSRRSNPSRAVTSANPTKAPRTPPPLERPGDRSRAVVTQSVREGTEVLELQQGALKGSNATPGAEPEDEHGPLFGVPFSAEEEAIPEATEDADQRRRALEWVDPEGLDEYSGDEFETDPDFEVEAEVYYETEAEEEPETDEGFEQPEEGQVTDPEHVGETEVDGEPETETEGDRPQSRS